MLIFKFRVAIGSYAIPYFLDVSVDTRTGRITGDILSKLAFAKGFILRVVFWIEAETEDKHPGVSEEPRHAAMAENIDEIIDHISLRFIKVTQFMSAFGREIISKKKEFDVDIIGHFAALLKLREVASKGEKVLRLHKGIVLPVLPDKEKRFSVKIERGKTLIASKFGTVRLTKDDVLIFNFRVAVGARAAPRTLHVSVDTKTGCITPVKVGDILSVLVFAKIFLLPSLPCFDPEISRYGVSVDERRAAMKGIEGCSEQIDVIIDTIINFDDSPSDQMSVMPTIGRDILLKIGHFEEFFKRREAEDRGEALLRV